MDVAYLLKCAAKQRAEWQRKAVASKMSLAEWMRHTLDAGVVLNKVVVPNE